MAELLFYVLSIGALCAAAGVVLAKSPMVSVISLLGSFFCLAVIYLLAGFQFLAAAQILVYAGAILVLFLFVIMLLNLGQMGARIELAESLFAGARARGGVVVAVGLGLIGLIAAQRASLPDTDGQAAPEGIDGLTDLAVLLFGRYALPLEGVAMLLLATMVAVMVLAKRQGARRSALTGASEAPKAPEAPEALEARP